MKIGCISLGCPKNLVDTEKMLGKLLREGFQITPPEYAEIVIINTCAFIEEARQESMEVIKSWINRSPDKLLIICGCLPVIMGEKLWDLSPRVRGILAPGSIDKITDAVKEVMVGNRFKEIKREGEEEIPFRLLTTSTVWSYLKIAEGCKNRCSYCLIPFLRGGYRSRKIEKLLDEARVLADLGIKEIILVAQDTTLYGEDIYGKKFLPFLLEELSRIEGIEWIRILYTHPAHFTDYLIKTISELPKVCKYLDIPIQHCNDRILKNMNRKVKKRDIMLLIEKLRKEIPQITLRSTVMVGFPGEGEKEFKELLQFLNDVEFDRLGVFTFSPQKGTPAEKLPDRVPPQEARKRKEEVYALQRSISYKKNSQKIGKTVKVILEKREGRRWRGRTEGDAPEIDNFILLKGNPGGKVFTYAQITGAFPFHLEGKIIKQEEKN